MGRRIMRAGLLAVASLAALGVAVQARAAGFYLQEQSVRGTGRAYSGEVADQGVASLWWNPAAIARSGREAYVGVNGVLVDADVDNTGSTVTYPGGITVPVQGEQRAFKPILPGVAPNLAIAAPVGGRFAVGLSVSAPFDFTTQYGPASWARYDGLTSELRTADVQMTGAIQVTDWLDLGVSADAEYTKARLAGAYPNLSPLLPDATSQLRGHGWDWSWSAGAQAHFGRLNLGASYRARTRHELTGSATVSGLLGPLSGANFTTAARATFTTPWIATIGARYALTDRLTLNGQVQRFGWSEFDAIRIQLPTGPQVLPQDYRDTTSGAVGVDFAATRALTLRAGVQYDPTPTPDAGRTARVPDGDRWLLGVGATADVAPRLKLDAAFAFIHFQDNQVNHLTAFYAGTPAATTTALAGRVHGDGYVLSLGVRSGF
jgi:long-chain fatty acid transport protein